MLFFTKLKFLIKDKNKKESYTAQKHEPTYRMKGRREIKKESFLLYLF